MPVSTGDRHLSVLSDIRSQPAAWTQALEVVGQHAAVLQDVSERPFSEVVYTGCGSTYYLTVAAAALHRRLVGSAARAVPAGELMLDPDRVQPGSLMIALSRSGQTTETVRAVEAHARAGGGTLVSVTCRQENELARHAQIDLRLPAAYESSVAQTRSFSSMWLATSLMIATFAGRSDISTDMANLPALCAGLITRAEPATAAIAADADLDRVYVLGSGVRYGLACEGSLLLKELALTDSEAFHFLEFRHGPIAMVTPRTLVIGLMDERGDELELSVLRDARAIGAHVLVLGDEPRHVDGATLLDLGAACEPDAYSGLFLPPLQLLALARATAAGLDTEHLRNLSAVIELA